MTVDSQSPAASGAVAALPDINAETHPFELVQRLLDQAAYLSVVSSPDNTDPAIRVGSRAAIGVRVHERLLRVESTTRMPGANGPLAVRNSLHDRLGSFRHRWMFAPDPFEARPGVVPPATDFDPSRTQRFVMLDGICRLGDGDDGFRGFGTGKTLPMVLDGKPHTLAAAVGTVLEGFGALSGVQGTYVYCGTLSPERGFMGSLVCRFMDPQRKVRNRGTLREPRSTTSFPADWSLFLFHGRKPKGSRDTAYLFDDQGAVRGLRVKQELRLIQVQSGLNHRRRISTRAAVGAAVGTIRSKIQFNLFDPGAPGTDLAPIPFGAHNTFEVVDAAGNSVGSFDADGPEGRTFRMTLPGAPGQAALRFGGFGPLRNGRGIFHGLKGVFTDNSAVGIAPHATSTLYALWVWDPEGRYREGLGGAASPESGPAAAPAAPGRRTRSDPFTPLLDRKRQMHGDYLLWRRGFRRCAEPFADAMAEAFNERLEVGEFPGLRIDRSRLRRAFRKPVGAFDPKTFNRYRGTAKGTFRTYAHTGAEVGPTSVLYSVWDPATETAGRFRYKRITGSFASYVPTRPAPDPSRGDVDLLVNSYHPELGVTSWVSIHQHRRQERTSFAYRLPHDDEVLWLVRDVSFDGKRIETDVFMASHEWKGLHRGRVSYFMVGIFFAVDFDKCSIQLSGDTWWRALYVEEPQGTQGTTT